MPKQTKTAIGGKRTPRSPGKGPGKSAGRHKVKVSRNDTFGLDLKDDIMIEAWSEPTEHTPKLEPSYIFPPVETRVVLMGFANRDRVLSVGHTGTGKTSLFEQVAARLNYNVIKISFDSCITRNDLVGEWVVKDGSMEFQYGIMPLAMRMPGTVIILDEWDTQNEDVSFVIQRLLQKEDGTRVQNYAQLNRFGLTIRMDYLKPELEKAMLMKRFDDLKQDEADAFIVTTNKVRDGFANNELSVPLSTRDLINWVEKYTFMGDPMKAATFCFLNRMSIEDAEVCKGIIQRSFEEA
jgi:cobaltochelatase CobS